MDSNSNGSDGHKPTRERHATAAQLYRLQELNALRLEPIGRGEPIGFDTANEILSDAETQGLWKSKRTLELEGWVARHYQDPEDELRAHLADRRLNQPAIDRLIALAHELRSDSLELAGE